MTRLFVIGNGFDMAHNLSTSFEEFKKYIENRINKSKKKEKENLFSIYAILNSAEGSYNCKTNILKDSDSSEWNLFETILAYIGSLNESEEYCKENSFRNDMLQENVLIDLQSLFTQWINSIDEHSTRRTRLFKNDDLFLNFNYTKTLQKNYRFSVCNKNINHIHVLKNKCNKQYHYGHGENFIKEVESPGLDNEKINFFGLNTKKDTKNIIQNNKRFYEKLQKSKIKELFFWGFSLSEVDKPYIEKIFEDNKSTITKVYLSKYQFYSRDKVKFVEFLKKYNLENKLESFNDHLIDNKTMKPFKRFISTIVFCIFVYQGVRMILGLNEVIKSKRINKLILH
ncbi:AbiH family protein [Staphylococcus saprophyticus]|uniref:AbiH family protein n=3 Tax=Staphylococcus saprophyticus TaxID=29385 RepID=UPI00289C24BF|nr:AbiH family protein [Staphylococcus saprophyticus]MDW3910801.1 AbiH family protein [Staphylococcus saprophyticus]MDW4179515.1 AbiH family protein [Staphylococcus saprophyticus]